ncbi:hypothetical protein FM101_08190 [Arthrobacter rhombi]|uniref:Uncharacterized protein n=1 Tax=Arthrobacter rhombi TaxID=71253 RepID=A0A1R4G6X7_9MICC|nr:hypothetical protein FM101_08190 [Arthrobacter rhombi]
MRILNSDLASGGRQHHLKRALMPGDYPPQIHPDDWEPDDESDRSPVQPE